MTPPEGFAFALEQRVRWADVDPQGVVFNPNYLVFADLGFTEYLRALGLPPDGALKEHGGELFVVRSEVDFRSPARFDDLIAIAARTARIGRSSFQVHFAIERAGERLADIRSTYVNADMAERRSVPLPEEFIARIEAFEAVRPERG